MLALGWTLFFALFAIGFLYWLAREIATRAQEGTPKWRWTWGVLWFLAYPFFMLGEIWDMRQRIADALKRAGA